jgi:hypothetical protein
VLHLIGTAGGDHWDGDVIPYMIDKLYVKSGIGAILINAVKVRLPGTKLLADLYQLQGIHAKAFPAAFEGVLIAAIWGTILEEFFVSNMYFIFRSVFLRHSQPCSNCRRY